MQYTDFIATVKILRMLFGVPIAKKFFLDNIKKFDKVIDSDSLINLTKEKKA